MISEELRRRFVDEGYFVLESVIPEEHLDALRNECQRFIDKRDAEMDAAGTDVIDLDQRGRRYFVNDCSLESPKLRRFLSSDVMAEICRATLGANAYLFNDQYVVKGADPQTRFSWHQDSGYIPYAHRPYLTCWCALDDVNEANGAVYLLPYSRAGTRDVIEHRKDDNSNDLIGYSGDDPGDPIVVPAGSIACFSSTVLHRSGPNTTSRMRRVYVAQYTAEPILSEDGSRPRHQAVPVVRDGVLQSL
jgi:ectoine hydroxylase-related dioxygenase (phytanoyl-CoA dioxygenase family)